MEGGEEDPGRESGKSHEKGTKGTKGTKGNGRGERWRRFPLQLEAFDPAPHLARTREFINKIMQTRLLATL